MPCNLMDGDTFQLLCQNHLFDEQYSMELVMIHVQNDAFGDFLVSTYII